MMNNNFGKLRIPTPIKKKSKFDLSFDHYTTSDFFRFKPVMVQEIMPGEDIDINLSTFTRLAPLQKPFFGSVNIINRAFFVPMRTVMVDFDRFITDTAAANGTKISKVPQISLGVLRAFFTTSSYGLTSIVGQNLSDFQRGSTGDRVYYKYTDKGRLVHDIIRCLGYHLDWANLNNDDVSFSAIPLLSFVKIYADWYINSSFQELQWLEPYTKRSGDTSLTPADLNSIFEYVVNVSYEKDYFTSAWLRPSAPNGDKLFSSYEFADESNDATGSNTTKAIVRSHSSATTNEPSTPSIGGALQQSGAANSVNVPNLSQYALDVLKKLTDYVKRFQLVGSRSLDRYKALFGITLPDAKLNRSQYLGKSVVPINIGEVMSTAETDSGELGDYAGRAVGFGQGHFHYKSDEYGFLIVISTILPHYGYAQGRPRYLQHIQRLDLPNSQFDGLGTQPIRFDELFADDVRTGQTHKPSQTFGFTSRYMEAKTRLDVLSGDFVLPSRSSGLDCFHLLRMFNPTDVSSTIEESFTYADAFNYDRVFMNPSESVDHFFMVFHFSVKSYKPLAAAFEDYEFEHGKEELFEIGGTQLD